VPVAAKITDLTEALRASVEEIRRRKSGGSATATAEKPEPRHRAKSA
jgi:non-homologous end joining protein Ku